MEQYLPIHLIEKVYYYLPLETLELLNINYLIRNKIINNLFDVDILNRRNYHKYREYFNEAIYNFANYISDEYMKPAEHVRSDYNYYYDFTIQYKIEKTIKLGIFQKDQAVISNKRNSNNKVLFGNINYVSVLETSEHMEFTKESIMNIIKGWFEYFMFQTNNKIIINNIHIKVFEYHDSQGKIFNHISLPCIKHIDYTK